jgi:hypothetical protein
VIKGNDINPMGFLGDYVNVHLKLGGSFSLKVTEANKEYLSGYDQEGNDILVQTSDIDFIIS